jgi:hypothetical protein
VQAVQGEGMTLQKYRPWRNRRYLDWVKSLPCVLTGAPADDPHHAIGVGLGGMGTKAPDWAALPVTRASHSRFHVEPVLWPRQWSDIAATLLTALERGVIRVSPDRHEEFVRLIGQALDGGVLK